MILQIHEVTSTMYIHVHVGLIIDYFLNFVMAFHYKPWLIRNMPSSKNVIFTFCNISNLEIDELLI